MADRWEQAAARYKGATPSGSVATSDDAGTGDRWEQAAQRYHAAAAATANPATSPDPTEKPSALRRTWNAATEDLRGMLQPDPRGVEGAPEVTKQILGNMIAPAVMNPEPYGKDHPMLNAVHAIPFVGPSAAQIGNDLNQGNYPEAVGHAIVPGLMSMAGGGPENAPIHAEVRSPVGLKPPTIPHIPGGGKLGMGARALSALDFRSPLNVRKVSPSMDPRAMAPDFRYGSTPRPPAAWEGMPEPMNPVPGDVEPIPGPLPSGRVGPRPEPVGNPSGQTPARNPLWQGTPAAETQVRLAVNPIPAQPRAVKPAPPARSPLWEGKVPAVQPKTQAPIVPVKAEASLSGRQVGGPENATGNVRASEVKPFQSEEPVTPESPNTVTSPETAPAVDINEFHAANRSKLAQDLAAEIHKQGVPHAKASAVEAADPFWKTTVKAVRPKSTKGPDAATVDLALEALKAREARFGVKPTKNKVWTKEADGGVVKMARGGVVGAPPPVDIGQKIRDRGGVQEIETTPEYQGLGESIIKASGKTGSAAPKLNVVDDPTAHVKEEQAFLRHPNLVKLKMMPSEHPLLKKLGIHISPGSTVRHAPHKGGAWKVAPVDLDVGKLRPGIYYHSPAAPKPPKESKESGPEPMRPIPGGE